MARLFFCCGQGRVGNPGFPTASDSSSPSLSAPFHKYLNVFIDPTCGWLRTVAQMRGLAYRSILFRQAGDAAAYLAAPLTCPLHAAVSHFQTMLHCQRRPRQPPTAHSRVRPRTHP